VTFQSANMKYVRTILSEPKFIGGINNQIFTHGAPLQVYLDVRPMHFVSCGSKFQGREQLLLFTLLANLTTFPRKTRCARAGVVIFLVERDAGTFTSTGKHAHGL